MNKEQYLKAMEEGIERTKKQIIKEIENNEFIPAQHSLNALRDLSTQKHLMEQIIAYEKAEKVD